MHDVTVLTEYRNRQVVLNYYQDGDFLWKRDGFHFTVIELINGSLVFSKPDGKSVVISLKEFESTAICSDFQNYYIFRNGNNRLEMYFPH